VAQWQGDSVTVWSSTQVPYVARSGVATTLELPESHVRIIVPHLGGGFGGKCEFHYEAHVAALARATSRPVRLVFSRSEEFIAPDHRREGQVIELETGVMKDGTLVARRGRLIARQRQAQKRAPPAAPRCAQTGRTDPQRVDRRQPGLHQHGAFHLWAAAPAAPRRLLGRRALVGPVAASMGWTRSSSGAGTSWEEGDSTATNQVLEPIGAAETLERAVELIGYGKELPDDEAIGVGIGWWPSFGGPSGAFVKLNGDGSGTIITGAQECGTGAVMALPLLVAEELGMRPEDFSILAQDTDAGGWDAGASGSQTTFNNGRAVIEAARRCASSCWSWRRRRSEAPRRPRACGRRCPGQGLADQVGADHHAGRDCAGRQAAPRQGVRLAAADPRRRRVRVHRPARNGDVRRAAVHHPRRPREGRPRDRRLPRARGRGLA
jgi:CO/xanthine dehydrogenase Mo-binding subunit